MNTDIEQYIIPQQDQYDTVVYGKNKAKKYWNPKTKTHRAWEQRSKTMVWDDVDYMSIVDNKWADYGRLKLLLECIDVDNTVCIRNGHSRKWIPVNSETKLKEMLGLKDRAWHDFKGKLDKADILKYVTIENGDGTSYMRYYVNPVYTLKDFGISLNCYKLFKESLDKVLPRMTRINLEKHLAEELGELITVDQLQNPADVFAQYVLNGKPADTFVKTEKGMVRGQADENVWFTVNEFSPSDPRQVQFCKGYRNFFIDIDAGKDSNGFYYNIKEVSKRKEGMKDVIAQLPTPTAIIETRNGFQLYWSIDESDQLDAEAWTTTEEQLVSLVYIADRKVKDAARVLRVPGSIHHKEGLDPFECKIVSVAPYRLKIEDMSAILTNTADKIQAACDSYRAQFPDEEPKRESKAAAGAITKPEQQSARIAAIAALSIDTFPTQLHRQAMTIQQAWDFYRQIDIAEFLQIGNPSSFNCIFHLTEGGDGNSASIYAPDKDHNEYRYICHCLPVPYYSVIDCVMELASCSRIAACNYLNSVYGLQIQRSQAA